MEDCAGVQAQAAAVAADSAGVAAAVAADSAAVAATAVAAAGYARASAPHVDAAGAALLGADTAAAAAAAAPAPAAQRPAAPTRSAPSCPMPPGPVGGSAPLTGPGQCSEQTSPWASCSQGCPSLRGARCVGDWVRHGYVMHLLLSHGRGMDALLDFVALERGCPSLGCALATWTHNAQCDLRQQVLRRQQHMKRESWFGVGGWRDQQS
eukprot:scaffold151946_cov22-Tisochrysis_lutea.AAC.1